MSSTSLAKISAEGCWSTIKAGAMVTEGQHVVHIRVDKTQTGAISIGLAQADTPIGDVVPGSPIVFLPFMWMPDHRMTFIQNLPTRDKPFGRQLKAGDVVTLTLNCDAGTLSVKCNSEDFGVAFKNVEGPVCPALSLSGVGDRVSLLGWAHPLLYGTSIASTAAPGAGAADAGSAEPPPTYMHVNKATPGLRFISDDPPIIVIDGFLTPEECRDLQAKGSRFLRRSAVVGNELSTSRTSSTCYLDRETCETLVARTEALTGKPRAHFELPQIARYQPTQEYRAHLDAFDLSTATGQQAVRNGGQRVGTVLVYLNDCPGGGHTHFTSLGAKVLPRQGTALIFFPCFLDGRVDRRLLHTGEPAVEEKWLAQLWIRQSTFFGVSSETQARQQAEALKARQRQEEGDDDPAGGHAA